MADLNERMELMRRVRLFSALSDEELLDINELLVQRRFRKGAVIFEQGDPGDSLYIVETGRVKAAVKDEQGNEKIVALYGEGEYFGEMALLTDQQRSASLAAIGDSTLLMLPKNAFETFMASNSQVMKQLLGVMTRRVSELNVRATSPYQEQAAVLGKVVVLYSPKGGTGKTTLAVNLATALRQNANRSVVLVDCSYPFGDVGVMMNLEPKRTITDLMPQVNELDGDVIESVLQIHTSGVKVLLAPANPEESEMITGEHLTMVLTSLRELFEFVIVDTHGTFTEVSLAALDMADVVFLVTTLELPVLKNVRQFVETVTTKLGYPREKLALVVNRASTIGGLSLADVEASVGLQVAVTVSGDGIVAVNATNRGVPIVMGNSNKNAQIYKDILNLAKLLAPRAIEENELGIEDLGGDEELTIRERLRWIPKVIAAQARAGIRDMRPADVFFGLGNLLLTSAPLLLVVTALGWIATALEAPFPTIGMFNLSIWISIVAGTFLLVRSRQPVPAGFWVQGGLLGAAFGLLIALPAVSATNALQGSVSVLSLIVAVIFYGLLGIAGTVLGQRLRRVPQLAALR